MKKKKEEKKNRKSNIWLPIVILVLVTFGVYYNSLNVPFIFDDDGKIVKNPDIKELSNIKTKLVYPYRKHKVWERNVPTRPVTYLTFTLNYYFGGLNTFGYHIFNVVFHILNSILIFFLSKKIILYTNKKSYLIFPLFVALIFAVHPVNTIVVSYIINRSGILSMFFYLLSLLLVIRTFENKKNLYIFSLLCFIMAIFSKQDAITLPAVILSFDYIFLSDFKVSRVLKNKKYHIPFWSILILYLMFKYFYLGGIGDLEASKFDRPFYFYFLGQPYVILRYMKLLLIPIDLCFDHFIDPAKMMLKFSILIPFLLGIIILSWNIYKSKAKVSKIMVFFILWFFITLSPTSSFFPTTTMMAENRLYIPGLGFYFMIVFVYFRIFCKKFSCSNLSKWILFSLIGIHIFLLCISTVKRNKLFQNPVLLWEDVMSKYPNNRRAIRNASLLHNDGGNLYYTRKEYNNAIQEYKKAIEINPNSALAYNNLAIVYIIQNDYSKALQYLQKAIEINPSFAKTHADLGYLLYIQGEYEKSLQEFEISLKLDPNNESIKEDIKKTKNILSKQ